MISITSITIIAMLCYIFGELYKKIFNSNEGMYCLLPLVVSLLGGAIGVMMFLTSSEVLGASVTVWEAMEIGIFSGASSTGTNQIVKQIIKLKGEHNGNKK